MAGSEAPAAVWQLVRVPFPTTNRPVRQYRPALVVARRAAAGSPALLRVLMITASGHRRWAGDVVISDAGGAGLPAPSMVRSATMATIAANEDEAIGALPPGFPMNRRIILDAIWSGTP